MKEIDFLPAKYREQNAVHKARLCQLAVALAFGGVIVLAAGFQFALYQSTKEELRAIAGQHADAVTKTAQLATLRGEAERQRQFCALYAYLKYPWPRTQILAEIARNLPPEVTLRELTIVEETHQPNLVRGHAIAVDLAKQAATGDKPAQFDLELLRSRQDQSRSEIQISGTTTDSAALHLFVMALNGTPLFESAKLHSLEAVSDSQQPRSKFLVRLTARAGFGQPGGPRSPLAVVAHDLPAGSRDRS